MIIACLMMVISCGIYAYSFNEVGNIFNELDKDDN